MIVVGFGLVKRAGCGALRLFKRPARFCRGLVLQRGMRPDIVVVIAPKGKFLTSIREAVEDLFIEAFIPQAAVEALNQAVLLRFAGVDVVPGNAGIARPFEDRGAGEFGGIITDDSVGFALNPDHRGQLPCHARARKAGIGNQPQILACAVIVDCQNAELAGCTEGVRDEIQ